MNYLLQALPGVVGIYLFGSFSTGHETSESDVDIAVLTTRKLKPLECWNIAQELALQLKRDVDLIDLLSASTVFKFEIIQQGRRIYCKDSDACSLFETIAFSSYIRFNEERKGILEDIKKRGSIFNG